MDDLASKLKKAQQDEEKELKQIREDIDRKRDRSKWTEQEWNEYLDMPWLVRKAIDLGLKMPNTSMWVYKKTRDHIGPGIVRPSERRMREINKHLKRGR